MTQNPLVLLRGGGDLATGVAVRLHRAGFPVMIAELPQPLAVRRAVAFSEAVYAGGITVESVAACLAADPAAGRRCALRGEIAVVVDPNGESVHSLRPPILIDARMAKRPLDTRPEQASLVIGLGPGFVAGVHCHAVVETNRGHHLGRVYWQGGAEPDTGQPEPVRGYHVERVLRAPTAGILQGRRQIGEKLQAGDLIATVDGAELRAPFAGVLRGLIHDGLAVAAGLKVGDLDPRGLPETCFTISDKARAVGGGVLEAVLAHGPTRALLLGPPGAAHPPQKL